MERRLQLGSFRIAELLSRYLPLSSSWAALESSFTPVCAGCKCLQLSQHWQNDASVSMTRMEEIHELFLV
jgi:hypothetical protein